MGYKVKLFSKDGKEPVLDAILSTEPKMQAKIYREINLLEEFGKELHFPHTRKIEGEKYEKLWELRVKQSSNIFRIFYFIYIQDTAVLLHAFTKKSNKTPKKELEIATERMKEYLENNKET